MSSGPIYMPGAFSKTEDLLEPAEEADFSAPYDEPDRFPPGVERMIAAGRTAWLGTEHRG